MNIRPGLIDLGGVLVIELMLWAQVGSLSGGHG
jgi:hypothetical protein